MTNIHRGRDLSVEEIRYWIVRKRRVARRRRLEHFWKTGRVLPLAGEQIEPDRSPLVEARKARARTSWVDRLLLGSEVLAVFSLIAMMGSGLSVLRSLNQNMASALQQPTLQPTPLVSEIVLPEGHTPPNSPGGARPNVAEVPENLRPVFFAAQVLPIPTSAPHQAIRIQIPVIGVDAPVVQGDSWEQLKKGVAQHLGPRTPAKPATSCCPATTMCSGRYSATWIACSPGTSSSYSPANVATFMSLPARSWWNRPRSGSWPRLRISASR